MINVCLVTGTADRGRYSTRCGRSVDAGHMTGFQSRVTCPDCQHKMSAGAASSPST